MIRGAIPNDQKGKCLIGALNYLADKGVKDFSFLSYNASGDGDNVWPFVERDGRMNYDCSNLDRWGIVFNHATARGLYLHCKLQENEMDDNSKFCLAKVGELYLAYLPNGGTADIDLSAAEGTFTVKWFNPREVGALAPALHQSMRDDWLLILRK